MKTLLPLIILLGLLVWARPAAAANLSYAGVTPSDARANIPSGVSHYVTFKGSTSIGSVNELRIDFTTTTGWFPQIGACLATAQGKVGGTNWPFDVVALPTSSSLGCTVNSSGVIDITSVGTLTSSSIYGVTISGINAIFGTPSAGVYSAILRTQITGVDQDTQTAKIQILGTTQISGSAIVPVLNQGTVNLSGFGAPNTLVTIQDGGSIVGTATIAGDGSWNKSLIFQTGNHSVGMFQEDGAGRRSSTVSFTITVNAGSTQSFSNIYFSPTIAISSTTVRVGDTLNIYGVAQPAAIINGTINSDPIPFTTGSDGNGIYNFPWTVTVAPGLHSTFDKSTNGTLVSDLSQVLGFQVNPNCRGADLNQDGRVNLTDFSILLFNWAQSPPGNRCADINSDGTVNLTDFSIMLFAWTG